MQPIKIRTTWKIQMPDGSIVGNYMTRQQAEVGIAKKIRENPALTVPANKADTEWRTEDHRA